MVFLVGFYIGCDSRGFGVRLGGMFGPGYRSFDLVTDIEL